MCLSALIIYPLDFLLTNEMHGRILHDPLRLLLPQKQKTIKFHYCSIWNDLPLEIRMSSSFLVFKKTLKIYLISEQISE